MEQQRIRLGELLMQGGLLTKDQLNSALNYQKNEGNGKKLGDILVEQGYVTEDDVCRVLNEKLGVPIIDIDKVQLSAGAITLVPRAISEKYCVVPVNIEGGSLTLAMSDPVDYYAIEDIRLIVKMDVRPLLATPSLIRAAIIRGYRQVVDSDLIDNANRQFNMEDSPKLSQAEIESVERLGNAPVVQLVNAMLKQAVLMRASDIHVEPGETAVTVRYRVDGELLIVMSLQMTLYSSLVTRIKILAGIDIAEKRLPQDGRFTAQIEGKPLQMRVSSMPTIYGEKLVLRLFGDSAMQIRRVVDLGMTESDHVRFTRMIRAPSGIVLVAGPTGSGKTTTLYAALCEIQRTGLNLCSIEDPVEKSLAGVNQVQTNQKAGLTFASGLRAMLRQDPDIIMIGEIRDAETASIAARAAITGHLVLSTIHTNDAASTFTRLIDMGVEPYMVSAAMVGVVSQRLVRLLCPHCKQAYKITKPKSGLIEGETVYRATGCEMCNGTGYQGRTAIHEQILVSPAVRRLVGQNATADVIHEQAVKEGFVSLQDNLLLLIRSGRTTVDELERIVYGLE